METNTKIDLTKLHADRLALEREICALKRELRTRWTRPMADEH